MNSTAIGYNAQPNSSNQIVLGTSSESVYIPGTAYNTTGTASSGALQVSGGVGIAGNLTVGGNSSYARDSTFSGNIILNYPITVNYGTTIPVYGNTQVGNIIGNGGGPGTLTTGGLNYINTSSTLSTLSIPTGIWLFNSNVRVNVTNSIPSVLSTAIGRAQNNLIATNDSLLGLNGNTGSSSCNTVTVNSGFNSYNLYGWVSTVTGSSASLNIDSGNTYFKATRIA